MAAERWGPTRPHTVSLILAGALEGRALTPALQRTRLELRGLQQAAQGDTAAKRQGQVPVMVPPRSLRTGVSTCRESPGNVKESHF